MMSKYFNYIISLFCVTIFIGYCLLELSGNDRPLKILFVGNSYTYRNDMPLIFEEICKDKGKSVIVESCTKGKASFQIQTSRKELNKAIFSRKWDIVILQGSSRDFVKDSLDVLNETLPAFELIRNKIMRNNPKTNVLLYMTWAYKNGYKPMKASSNYNRMTNLVKNAYLNLSTRFNLGVVPVGMAWKSVRSERDDVNLYVKDGAHPSLKGSYLAACCFYTSIFKERATGAKYYSKLGPKICTYLQKKASKLIIPNLSKFNLSKI
jgi:hypothetical protein